MANRVQQHEAVVLKQRIHLCEEFVIMAHADMLEHADRDNAIKASSDIAVIEQLEADTVA